MKINEKHKKMKKQRPIRVLQFGEGNFLRGFIDYGIDVANEKLGFNGDVAIIKARPGSLERFHAQDNMYTVALRGIKNGKVCEEDRIITCVQKTLGSTEDYDAFMQLAELDTLEFVISNTTEAGIIYEDTDKLEDRPPKTYPGKLTKFLYERFNFYNGAKDKGLTILPVELIEKNGENLKQCVLQYTKRWQLGEPFEKWLETANLFAGTLVDRIITGYPKTETTALTKKWGYEDNLIVMGEPFGLWVIGDARVEKQLKISSHALTVEFTNELEKYKERKVRILNGAHTSMVLGAYLAGKNYVRECMEDPLLRKQIEKTVLGEIVPTVHMAKEKAEEFARFVFERFENPFVRHALLSIALNSVSKWKVRVLPTLKDIYARDGKLPKNLTFSFAAFAAFYRTSKMQNGYLIGTRGSETYKISDDKEAMKFFHNNADKPTAEYAALLAGNTAFWGEDLTKLPGFLETTIKNLESIEKNGMMKTIETLTQ